MMKHLFLLGLLGIFCGASAFAEPAEAGEAAPAEEANGEEAAGETDWKSLPNGVRYRVLHEGDGKKAGLWAGIYVHYRLKAEDGTILADTFKDKDHGGRAHKHVIGSGTMIEALEMAATTMRERERRKLLIPVEHFSVSDFHSHEEGTEHDSEDHDRVVAALRPNTMVEAEMSLIWVREYDPSNFNRFR